MVVPNVILEEVLTVFISGCDEYVEFAHLVHPEIV